MKARGTAAAALLMLLPGLAFGAAWELVPKVEAGGVYETNPRYLRDCPPDAAPNTRCGNQYVMGTYVDAQVSAAWRTPDAEIRLTPRVRDWNYLGSNKDLNNDDLFLNLSAIKRYSRLQAGLAGTYSDTLVRQQLVEGATPDDPDAPPPSIGGASQEAVDGATQERLSLSPYINYSLSQRTVLALQAGYASSSFDNRANPRFFDFDTTSAELALVHSLDPNNQFRVAVNASTFQADNFDRVDLQLQRFENETDNYGVSASYERVLSQTLTASLRLGTVRNSTVVTSGTVGQFRSTQSTLVGNLGVRKRSERTTLNFDIGRTQVPRSDGRQVNQDEARFFVDHNFTERVSGRLGVLGLDQSTIGDFDRFEQRYWSTDLSLAYRLLPGWSVRGLYSIRNTDTDLVAFGDFARQSSEFEQSNRRIFFSVTWSGIGWRR